MPLSPRLRWKLDRYRQKLEQKFGAEKRHNARPRLCPACGRLVGAGATRCHECGANLQFGLAAASRSLGRLLPATSPASYGILSLCCLIYGASLIATMRAGGFAAPNGGFSAIFDFGGINGRVLDMLGASRPLGGYSGLPGDLAQPWRFLTAIFLHASVMHIAFNMWVLMDVGPAIEELYGSARYFFIFVLTGICGFILSSATSHAGVGASGGLLGLMGVLLAITSGRRSIEMQVLRGNVIRWLIYVALMAFVPGLRIDNFGHLGGFLAGFALGKIMADRAPVSPQERKRAYLLGWITALAVVASFARIAYGIFARAPF